MSNPGKYTQCNNEGTLNIFKSDLFLSLNLNGGGERCYNEIPLLI